jgi:hypothetical protein
MSTIVVADHPDPEPAPDPEPSPTSADAELLTSVGEIRGMLESLKNEGHSHPEIMECLARVEGKCDSLVSWVEELSKVEVEPEPVPSPVDDLTIVVPEPEPEPPEHPLFRKL